MKRIFKWLGLIFGGMIGLIFVLSSIGSSRLNKVRDIKVKAITIPTDTASLARGEEWVKTTCTSCHGADLSGAVMINQPGLVTIYASNITGLASIYSETDFVRGIRHAVGPDGRPLAIMPAEIFIHYSAEDLGAIIAYLQTVSKVGKDMPEPQFAFLGKALLSAGLFGKPFPADYIDHNMPFPKMLPIAANAAYGSYLKGFCVACHGADLRGAQPISDPTFPFAPDLTPAGELGSWTQSDFLTAMRFGIRPNGQQIDSIYMPWREFGQRNDPELIGLWKYLESLPTNETVLP